MTTSLENLKSKIAKNIKLYRKKARLTQIQLSLVTGLVESYIAFLETGKRSPSLKTLAAIADALNIKPYELLK